MKGYEGNEIEGWMSMGELEWLYNNALGMRTILEVGCWKGRSTHALLSTGKPVVAVDHFRGSASQVGVDQPHEWVRNNDLYAAFKENVGMFPNLFVMKMTSRKASEFFKPRSIDMIFVDGDHEYHEFKRDFLNWVTKCSLLFCGHDIEENGVPEVFADLGVKFYRPVDSIWCAEGIRAFDDKYGHSPN